MSKSPLSAKKTKIYAKKTKTSPEESDLNAIILAAIAFGVIVILIVVLLFFTDQPNFALWTGGATFLCILVKAAATTFARDINFSEASRKWLEDASSVASLFMVVFGAPATLVTLNVLLK
ncbi:hypothetical protein I6E52_08295 [Salinibacterium sp. NG253]|uniref:hypothetical protein n=1 Tax=Salinibacterium sp. NG253 TaxID=2792039 RepID=UPI0018CD38DE|nr:hypothetical protein [Salinibacterium sp. NG253]MBH0116847.1 hypothetical protein [Salinibacterium sp. NG253]